jgi:hypothetical protein
VRLDRMRVENFEPDRQLHLLVADEQDQNIGAGHSGVGQRMAEKSAWPPLAPIVWAVDFMV